MTNQVAKRRECSGSTRLFVATGAFRATQNMAQTTLSLLGRSLGLTGSGIGAVAAGANLLGVLTMVLVTARLTTGHARRAVFAGLVIITASLVSFVIPSRAALVIGAALLGIAGGLALPAVATTVGDRALSGATRQEPERSRVAAARALALLSLVLSISLAIGPLYESLVLAVAHQRLRVAYMAFLPIVVVGVAAACGRESSVTAPVVDRATLTESLAGLAGLFANRRWGLAMCAQAIYTVPFTVVVVFAGLLGRTLYHTSASMTEVGITLFFLVSFLCRAALTRRPAVARRVPLFGLSVLTTLCGIGLLATGVNTGLFMVALAVLGAPHGLTYPLALGLVAESVPNAELSRANAGFAAVSNAINVVAPLSLGVVIDDLGDRIMLLCAAVPVVLLAMLLWRLRDGAMV